MRQAFAELLVAFGVVVAPPQSYVVRVQRHLALPTLMHDVVDVEDEKKWCKHGTLRHTGSDRLPASLEALVDHANGAIGE